MLCTCTYQLAYYIVMPVANGYSEPVILGARAWPNDSDGRISAVVSRPIRLSYWAVEIPWENRKPVFRRSVSSRSNPRRYTVGGGPWKSAPPPPHTQRCSIRLWYTCTIIIYLSLLYYLRHCRSACQSSNDSRRIFISFSLLLFFFLYTFFYIQNNSNRIFVQLRSVQSPLSGVRFIMYTYYLVVPLPQTQKKNPDSG